MPRGMDSHLYDSSGVIDSTGSANAYVVTVDWPVSAYHRGMPPIRFKANFSNTGAATVNVATVNAPSGLGAVNLRKAGGGTALASGDIASGGVYTIVYDGSVFQVLELTGPAALGSVSVDTLTVNTNANPDANDGAGLGTGALSWSDLFLASGGVINWANADVRITHSSNALAFEDATIYSFDNNVVVGHSAAIAAIGGTPKIQAIGTDGSSSLLAVRYGASASPARLELMKSRGAAIGNHTVVNNSDTIAELIFSASDGTNFVPAARILAYVNGTPGANDMPGGLTIATTADGASSVSTAFEITNDGATRFARIGTTASAANAFLDSGSSNNLLRSTSSRRYKRDVDDLPAEAVERVLRLRPVRYRSNAQHDRRDWSWYGLIAEDVAAIEPRLVHYDADGQPDGVQYDRIAVLLLAVIKQQESRIAALEARLG